MAAGLELAYLGVEVADLAGTGEFFAGIAGMIPGEPTSAGEATWRMDARAHRIIVSEGPANDAVFFGFEAIDQSAFDAAVARVTAAGASFEYGSPALCAERRVDQLVRIEAPWDVPVEIVLGLAEAATPFASELVPDGFVTAGQGFGHVVMLCEELAPAEVFTTEVLGLSQSDWLEQDLGGLTLNVRFYHCNPRHHSFALGSIGLPAPTHLHHVMIEVPAQDTVGAAFDRAFVSGRPIANGLGKHDNDKMFSFYVVSPAGFQLEFGCGARTISEPWTENRKYDRISEWGHQPIPTAP